MWSIDNNNILRYHNKKVMQQLKIAATEIVESQIMKCFYCPNSDKQ